MHKTDFKVLFIGCALFLATILFANFSFGQENAVSPADTTQTQSVVSDQLMAFKSGDHARAYSHAAPNITNYFTTLESFTGMVKGGYGAIYQSDSFIFGRNTSVNGEIYQEVFITDPQGKQWQAVYTLQRQTDGTWKITGVKMNPHKGAST